MSAILGAAKGASRGLILLLAVALVPGLAWLIATTAAGAFDLGFRSIFFGVLALEIFLGACALFGMASEVQKKHAESVDPAAHGRNPQLRSR